MYFEEKGFTILPMHLPGEDNTVTKIELLEVVKRKSLDISFDCYKTPAPPQNILFFDSVINAFYYHLSKCLGKRKEPCCG